MDRDQQAERLANSGFAFHLAGNFAAAERDFRAALASDPDHIRAHMGLVQVHLAFSRFQSADKVAKRLLQLAPNLSEAHWLQGEIYRRQDFPAEAEKSLRESIRLSPGEFRGYHSIAMLQLGRKRYAQALRTIDEARRIDPANAVLIAQHAEIMLHAKGAKAAEPLALEALRLRDDNAYVLIRIAKVFVLRGRRKDARDLLQEVLQRNAGNEEAISLYLLTDKRRRLMRWRERVLLWRMTGGISGKIIWQLGWMAILGGLLAIAITWRAPLVVMLGAFAAAVVYVAVLRRQYARHRRQVKEHFARMQLASHF